MSIEAVSFVLNDAPDVPPQCVAVLIGLANHAHANGRAAFPSQERLALYARKSVRSVQNDLKTLERAGVIRRGDQRHVLFIPIDRRPVVWDVVMDRRREVPGALDPFAEPQSGRATEVPDRGETECAPVADRGEGQYRPARSRVRSGTKPAAYKPYPTVKEPSKRSARDFSKPQRQWPAATEHRGAALPTPRAEQCPVHVGQPARTCSACRSERIAAAS